MRAELMVNILIKKITPKRNFDFAFFEQEFRTELQDFGKNPIKTTLQGTTKGWKHRPDFGTQAVITPDTIGVRAFASGANKDQYNLVVAGSKAHIITPKSSQGTLVFRTGYIPATRPGSLQSRGPRIAGRRQPKFVKVVRHPGFTGRDFYALTAETHKADFVRRSENALRRAATRLNASMK